ncbi:MAG TPA: heme o synthase [Phycisphaerae bacterium]|nr:heme o synthase [Phycisphaerae bacterium]
MTQAQPVSAPVEAAAARRGIFSSLAFYLRAYGELGKLRLNAMVVVTTALGFVVGSYTIYPTAIDVPRLLWTCMGTLLAAIGASAFNQSIEGPRDARMKRTQGRPVPSGRVSRGHAAYVGLLATIAGVAILCPTSNGLTALLALANVILYAAIYTPLKTHSTTNTLVGAVVGGIPPVMGWTAATGAIAPGAIALGLVLFVWQIPHFLALAWMYKDDYARGGYKMVSTADPQGKRTAILSVVYSLALIPPSLALVFFGDASGVFGCIALLLAAWMAFNALRFAADRTVRDARRLFLTSIAYLPLLSLALVLCVRTPMLAALEPTRGALVSPDAQGDGGAGGTPVIDPDLTQAAP